jgi:general secretion pathway protein A
MYEAFYGFKKKPFSMLPDPDFLYLSKQHQAALTLLEYGLMNHIGFCVISGEPGAGKTTILRALLKTVGDEVVVGLITNTHQSFGGLLDWILSAFDLHKANLTRVEMHQVFMDYLIEQYSNNRTVLLIVDEAQNMNADSLEELRLLSNVNSEKDQLLQIILAGQPALKELLRLPELKQFAQRIAVDYHLEQLGLKETFGYIQHRLVTAGAKKDVFTPAACERIFNYSGGTPRLINLLCETVLVYGFADQRELIDVDLVEEMVHERMKGSVVPIVNRDVVYQKSEIDSMELEKDFPWILPEAGIEELTPEVKETNLMEQQTERQQEQQGEQALVSGENISSAELTDEQAVADSDVLESEKDELTVKLPDEVKKGKDKIKKSKKKTKTFKDNVIPTLHSSQEINSTDKVNRYEGLERPAQTTENRGERKKQVLLYGAIVVVLALFLLALVLKDENGREAKVVNDEAVERQRADTEALKAERDDAIAKIEEEPGTKLETLKRAAEIDRSGRKAANLAEE